jgi:hypothetical protein
VVRAYRSQALLGLGRAAEATREARAALDEIATKAGREHRFYWEALAIQTQAACAAGHGDCVGQRERVDQGLRSGRMPGGARLKLQAALAAAGTVARR